MFSVYLECAAGDRDELIAELNERGTLGVLELASGVRAWFEEGVAVDDLIERFDGIATEEPDSDEDWVRRTEESFPPLTIGERFWLVPPWNKEPAPAGRMRLEIMPGAACGTGWHECTQLCLEAMERYVVPGCSMLDVGAGSGILSVAARLLGASRVIACDIDEDAVMICRDRLASNTVYVGTADAAAACAFDVVVANISGPAIRDLYPNLTRARRPGGTLIVSGFPEYPLDVPPRELERRGEWLCAVL